MTMRVLPYLCALVLGVGAAVMAGCGDRSKLIPAGDAGQVEQQLSAVKAAVADGDCGTARTAVLRAQRTVINMTGVDRRLKQRLSSGLDRLATRASTECDEAASTPTTTTKTIPTTETTAPETTSTDETPSVPTDTATDTEPDTPVTPTPTDPEDGGGVSPEPPDTGTTDPSVPDPGGVTPPPDGTGDPGFRGAGIGAGRHPRDHGPLQGYLP